MCVVWTVSYQNRKKQNKNPIQINYSGIFVLCILFCRYSNQIFRFCHFYNYLIFILFFVVASIDDDITISKVKSFFFLQEIHDCCLCFDLQINRGELSFWVKAIQFLIRRKKREQNQIFKFRAAVWTVKNNVSFSFHISNWSSKFRPFRMWSFKAKRFTFGVNLVCESKSFCESQSLIDSHTILPDGYNNEC